MGAIMGDAITLKNTPRELPEASQPFTMVGAVGIEPTTSPV